MWQYSRDTILEGSFVLIASCFRTPGRNVQTRDADLAHRKAGPHCDTPMAHRVRSDIDTGRLDTPASHEHPISIGRGRGRERHPEAVVRKQLGQYVARLP